MVLSFFFSELLVCGAQARSLSYSVAGPINILAINLLVIPKETIWKIFSLLQKMTKVI